MSKAYITVGCATTGGEIVYFIRAHQQKCKGLFQIVSILQMVKLIKGNMQQKINATLQVMSISVEN